jgi:hypothetical protein
MNLVASTSIIWKKIEKLAQIKKVLRKKPKIRLEGAGR